MPPPDPKVPTVLPFADFPVVSPVPAPPTPPPCLCHQYVHMNRTAAGMVRSASTGVLLLACGSQDGTTTMQWARMVNNNVKNWAQINGRLTTQYIYAVGAAPVFTGRDETVGFCACCVHVVGVGVGFGQGACGCVRRPVAGG